jgi:glycerol-3-phosphate acyltransferase PlsY
MSEVNWPAVAASAAASYALGSLSPAAAAARLRGADLRGTGSGNPGATNAARTMGVPVGIAVGLLDVAKGYVPVWYFRRYGAPCGEVAGFSAALGHVTSPLLKGRGGKGVATSLGAILAIEPLWAVPAVGAFAAVTAATHQIGVGSAVGSMTLVPSSLVIWRGRSGVGFALAMSGIVLYRHRRNIRSFVAGLRAPGRDDGTEPAPESAPDAGAGQSSGAGLAGSAAPATPPTA